MKNALVKRTWDLIIVGGGAAGFFAAVNYLERKPKAKVLMLEASNKLLAKVKISGGGRCNVTHACWEPKELVQHYPRGKKEMLGPFHQFACGDTVEWFDKRGVTLKIEEDGRMFPESNESQTIIDCLLDRAQQLGLQIKLSQRVSRIVKEEDSYTLQTQSDKYNGRQLFWATGGSEMGYKILEDFGIDCESRVPSLFSFNIKEKGLTQLMGLSMPNTRVDIKKLKLSANGPLLITHWGISGPGVLKLSAVGARKFAECNYRFEISVNWLNKPLEDIVEGLKEHIQEHRLKQIQNMSYGAFPKRLWFYLLERAGGLDEKGRLFESLKAKEINRLAELLHQDKYVVSGRTTYKEEFVTAGGIKLKAIDFKTMQLKEHSGFYLAGEVINVDAVTGGFNFQNAWTGGWIASQNMD